MKTTKKYRTDSLFSKSSFLIGAGSVLNIKGNYFTYNSSLSDKEADTKAIMSDWGVVGQDIKVSITKFKKTITQE